MFYSDQPDADQLLCQDRHIKVLSEPLDLTAGTTFMENVPG